MYLTLSEFMYAPAFKICFSDVEGLKVNTKTYKIQAKDIFISILNKFILYLLYFQMNIIISPCTSFLW